MLGVSLKDGLVSSMPRAEPLGSVGACARGAQGALGKPARAGPGSGLTGAETTAPAARVHLCRHTLVPEPEEAVLPLHPVLQPTRLTLPCLRGSGSL